MAFQASTSQLPKKMMINDHDDEEEEDDEEDDGDMNMMKKDLYT